MSMTLHSPAFGQGADIPAHYTCDGGDASPPLSWNGIPAGTQSLALIVEDPDAPDPAAPKRVFTHWVLYDIPPDAAGITEGAGSGDGMLPAGTRTALNDWQRADYGGPCPPIGKHRYFHRLYALDTILPDLGNSGKTVLLQAMQGHVLGQAELIGLYRRQQ